MEDYRARHHISRWLPIAKRGSYLYASGPSVGIIYILAALGYGEFLLFGRADCVNGRPEEASGGSRSHWTPSRGRKRHINGRILRLGSTWSSKIPKRMDPLLPILHFGMLGHHLGHSESQAQPRVVKYPTMVVGPKARAGIEFGT